jgi:hypothetical protein
MSSVFALIALFAAVAAEQPCRAAPRGGALDFWLGEWTVTSEDGTAQYGGNSIEMAAEGCAVFERRLSASGGEGYSLFAFDARNETWEQTWVTGDTSRPGGPEAQSDDRLGRRRRSVRGPDHVGVGRDLPRPDDADAA